MDWIMVQSAERPETTDTTSSKAYNYVRKDIEEIEVEDLNGDTRTIYQYMEAKVPKSSWSMYQELEQAKADIDYLTMITEE